MSAEGKKKRGESGLAKAKNSPFRLNGRPVDWAARQAGAFNVAPAASSGSVTMRGLLGGLIAARLFGRPLMGNEGIFDRMIAHAQKRVTHDLLRL